MGLKIEAEDKDNIDFRKLVVCPGVVLGQVTRHEGGHGGAGRIQQQTDTQQCCQCTSTNGLSKQRQKQVSFGRLQIFLIPMINTDVSQNLKHRFTTFKLKLRLHLKNKNFNLVF